MGDASQSPPSPIPSPAQLAVSSPRQATATVPLHTKKVPQAPSQTSSATGVVETLMHKCDLNSYCQRLAMPLPVYKTTFEGSCHAPRFTSTVSIGDKSFTSSTTFLNRKSAEQDAAKLALQHLLTEDEATATPKLLYLRKLVCQDKARCKMILNEFLDKIKMRCAYETLQVETTPPVFVSSLVIDGTCYKGEGGKNKKEAEQLAALATILSLLDDPAYVTPISEVIKSKFNVCAVSKELKNTREFKATTSNSDVMHLTQQALSIGPSSSGVLVDEKLLTPLDSHANNIEEQGSFGMLESKKNQQVLQTSLPQTEKQSSKEVLDDIQGLVGHSTGAVTSSRCSYVNLPINPPLISEPQDEIKSASQQISIPIESVQVVAAHSPGNDLISSKKRRRKNKNKANKRLRAAEN